MPHRAEDSHSGHELGEAWKLFRTNICWPQGTELNTVGLTHPRQFSARRIQHRPPDLEVSVCRPQVYLFPVTCPSSTRPRTASTCRTPRKQRRLASDSGCVTSPGQSGGPRTASPQSDRQRVFSWAVYLFLDDLILGSFNVITPTRTLFSNKLYRYQG